MIGVNHMVDVSKLLERNLGELSPEEMNVLRADATSDPSHGLGD